jgi:hypothetical protein
MKPDLNSGKKPLKDLCAQVAKINNNLAKTGDAALGQLADVRSSEDTPCAQKPDEMSSGVSGFKSKWKGTKPEGHSPRK